MKKATKKIKPVRKKKYPSVEKGENFFDSVYAVVCSIPRGRVTTYGAVAEATGMRMSARMVGWALSISRSSNPRVPAHRVVNRMGILTGRHHFATPDLMQELLEQEGVKVLDNTVVDFRKLFWAPPLLK